MSKKRKTTPATMVLTSKGQSLASVPIDYGAYIIEVWAPGLIRIGLEGKWIEFIGYDPSEPQPSRKQLRELIEQKDRERTQ